MKRILLMIVALPFCFAAAQNLQRPGRQQRLTRDANGALTRMELKKEEKKAEMKDDLNKQPSIEPSEKMTVSEFQLKRNKLKGQVVELTFDKVVSLKQAGQAGYMARVTYESPRLAEGLNLIIPKDGLEFFEKLSKPEVRRRETVYIQVLNGSLIKALGTRYRKDKPEGERYNW